MNYYVCNIYYIILTPDYCLKFSVHIATQQALFSQGPFLLNSDHEIQYSLNVTVSAKTDHVHVW